MVRFHDAALGQVTRDNLNILAADVDYLKALLIAQPELVQQVLEGIDVIGWARYRDTQYTFGSPLHMAGIGMQVLNNGGTALTGHLPTGSTYYDPVTSRFLGHEGDLYLIAVDFGIKRSDTNSGIYEIDIWLNAGGTSLMMFPAFDMYRTPDAHGFSKLFVAPVNADWEANGAKLFMKTNTQTNVYDIGFTICQLAKA